MAGLGAVFGERARPLVVVTTQLPSRLGCGLAHLAHLESPGTHVEGHVRHRRTGRRVGRDGARTATKEDVTNGFASGNRVFAAA